MPNPTSEFILKVTPQNSGSQHLVLGTETIPTGGVIPKHRHLGQDEILFLQTGSARVSLNDQDYEVHAGGMVFFPLNTWVSLRNTGAVPIQLIVTICRRVQKPELRLFTKDSFCQPEPMLTSCLLA